jgi:hypothetical protein
MFSCDTTKVNRIRELFSNGFITTKEVAADKHLSAASIAASDSIPLVGVSVGRSCMIGVVVRSPSLTIVGVVAIIGASASIA